MLRGGRRSGRVGAAVGALALVVAGCNSTGAKPTAAERAGSNLDQGLAAQRAGNLSLAVTNYDRVLRAEPRNAYALYDLGTIYQDQGNENAAASQYRAAIVIDPKFVSALFNLAIIVTKATPGEAETLYRQVLQLAPDDAGAHYNLGAILERAGQRAAALAEFDTAHRLDAALTVPSSMAAKGVTGAKAKSGKTTKRIAGATGATGATGRSPRGSGVTTTT